MKKWLFYFPLAFLGMLVAIVAAVLVASSWLATQREIVPPKAAAPKGGKHVKAADVEIFVQEEGPADGFPVLFVHGTGAWSEAWRGVMRAVGSAGMRAIALDLPPFGFSQRPDTPRYSKEDQGKRIVGVLDALQLKEAVLVGHSFGGGPTMEAALRIPDRVRAVVLVDAALSISEGEPAPAPLPVRAFLDSGPVRDGFVATFLTNPLFTRKLLQAFIDDPERATDEWVAVYQRPLVVTHTTAAVGTWLPALLAPASVAQSARPASYRTLKTPLYIIWGERDTITPLAQAEQLARLAPRSELAVMKAVGHIPQIEDPAAFNKLLLEQLSRALAASR
jgi:pimeloyl-ACP methyl ester carboxylesterase